MRQLDLKNRKFYDELTVEERKKFSTFIMLRWASAIQSSNNKNFTHDDIASYYIQVLNLRANKHFWSLSRHPKLQWLCATTVSPGMGAQRHNWIAPKKKEAGASAKRKQLAQLFPHYKDDEIDVMMKITTQKEIDEYRKASGKDKK